MGTFNANPIIHGGLTAGAGDDAFATEVWGPAVEAAIKEKMVLDKLCTDLTPLVASQGEKIHLPKIDQVAAGDKGEGAISWSTDSTGIGGEETLNVNKHKYAAALINDVIAVQGNYDLMNLYAKELGYSIANAVDVHIEQTILDSMKTASGLNAAVECNVSATPFNTEADFDVVASSCFAHDPDPNNWTIVIPPSIYANLMNIADLSLATMGSALGAQFTQTGVVSKAYGFNIMMSQNVQTATVDMDTSGTDNKDPHGYVVHKSACYIAFSQRARLQSQYDVDYLGTKVIADTIFGALCRYGTAAGEVRCFLLT